MAATATSTATGSAISCSNIRGKRFAVTGGCGFVGHRLVLHLLCFGAAHVRALDVLPERCFCASPYDPVPAAFVSRSNDDDDDDDDDADGSDERRSSLAVLFARRVEYQRCDLRSYSDVSRGLAGVDAVLHVASFGMSGKDMLNRTMVTAVNVGGTENVLRAAIEHGVSVVCYTSTTNVCFGGRPLVHKDETLPYLRDDEHIDYYSRTKCIAEQLIIRANGAPLRQQQSQQHPQHKRGKQQHRQQQQQHDQREQQQQQQQQHQQQQSGHRSLRTCAIRPAGIYGEGEQRHLPRIVGLMRKGMFCFTIGQSDSLVEFVYVDNLVDAHILAVDKLLRASTEDSSHSGDGGADPLPHDVAGQAFFVSDGQPINNFEFFRPLLEGLGYRFPMLRLPTVLVYYTALVIELTHHAVSRVYNFQPLLTRAEVCKVAVTHYFSIEKARQRLGYTPRVSMDEGMRRVVQHYRDELERQRVVPSSARSAPFFGPLVWLLVVFVVLLSSAAWYHVVVPTL